MGCVGRLSSVELDIFLTSASPDQRAIVRTLRDIISRRAGDLAERVNKDKELTGTCNTDRGSVQITGKVDEKNVTWKYQSEYNGSPLTVSFKGTMDSATKIKGRVAAEEFGVEGDFTATQSK